MLCPNCGKQLDERDGSCTACGARLVERQPGTPPEAKSEEHSQEQVLHRFGALGVGITWARPSLWVWTKHNMIEVVLTDERLCGVWNPSIVRTFFSSRRGQLYFQIPLRDILAIEQLTFMLRKVVWVQFREGGTVKEVSIEGDVFRHQAILRLYELLRGLLKNQRVTV